jgi:hypothetical protein
MSWIKFSDRKPDEGGELITRSTGWDKKGDAFENWRIWSNKFLTVKPPITHWWDGEFDIDLAAKEWEDKE